MREARQDEYIVATASFDDGADLGAVSQLFSAFAQAFCPPAGLHVRVARGARREVLPARFSPTANVKAAQLARGGCVELSRGPSFAAADDPVFWIANEPADEARPLRLGACALRPPAKGAEEAVLQATSALIEAAAEVPGCVVAWLGARATPSSALEDEGMRRAAADGARAFRVLVPVAKVRALPRPPPDDVTLKRGPNGVLVVCDATSPFARRDDAIEAWLAHAGIR